MKLLELWWAGLVCPGRAFEELRTLPALLLILLSFLLTVPLLALLAR